MNPIKYLMAFLAPDSCVVCQAEGSLLCQRCRQQLAVVPPRCYNCLQPSPDFATCRNCRAHDDSLDGVIVRTSYQTAAAKQLLWKLKFDRSWAAAAEIAELLVPLLAAASSTARLVPVPTAAARVRARGYDQAQLIARYTARRLPLPVCQVLVRQGKTDQIGASRLTRQQQLVAAFRVVHPDRVAGRDVILVDDVITTGATLTAAAICLKAAGAQKVTAIVLAAA